jgi:tetratricopeptide (TPR) repeat protein
MQGEESQPLSPPSVQNILAAEQWAKDCLGNASAEAQWNNCIAETFRDSGYWNEAIVRYRKVIASGKHTWQLHFGLARSLRANEQFAEAIMELDELLEENVDRLVSDTPDGYANSYWEAILPELARSLIGAEDMIRAEETCKTMLDESLKRNELTPWAMRAVTDLSRALTKQGKYHDVIAVLENLAAQPDEIAGNWLCLLLHTYAHIDNLHDEIHAVARSADSLVSPKKSRVA